MLVLKVSNSKECKSSEDTVTDLRHCELWSLQVYPVVWEKEQPASEEQLGWASFLGEVTYQVITFRQQVGSLTSPGFPALVVSALLFSYPDKHSGALVAVGL